MTRSDAPVRGVYQMRYKDMLIITSQLAILFMTLHLTSDTLHAACFASTPSSYLSR